jgi:hypothetical protein
MFYFQFVPEARLPPDLCLLGCIFVIGDYQVPIQAGVLSIKEIVARVLLGLIQCAGDN